MTHNAVKKIVPKAFIYLLMLLLATACGFHLRGQTPIPTALKTLFLTTESGMPNFDRSLQRALKKAEITIVSNSTIADDILELKISAVTLSDKVLSTDSDNETSSITRTLTTTYFIRAKDGKSLYGPRTVRVKETLYNQNASNSVVEAHNATQLILMQKELADNLRYDLAYAPL